MKRKKLISGAILTILLAALAVFFYVNSRGKDTSTETKSITIEVVDSKGKETLYTLTTEAAYLQQAMEEAKKDGLTFEGEKGPYGLQVMTVNGERAVYEKDGAYWGFYVNGVYCNYGISKQPVKDKDAFRIVYTKAE